MKVLQITTNYPCKENPIFGIFMKEQVESLEHLGVENTIFFSNGLRATGKGKYNAKWIHIRSAIKLFFHLLTHKYDIIHCHSVISGLIFYFAQGHRLNNKSILSLQNDPTVTGSSDAKYFKKLYPIFNKIIIKTTINSDFKKIIHLPNGVNTSFFKPLDKISCKKKLGLNLNSRYILFVDSNSGKARTQKRRDRFDKTLEILRTTYGYTNIKPLIMIGIDRDLVPIYINACDLHLLCSDQEGSPNSVKECMACNIPCVTTPVGNVKELFDGIDGCYYSKTFSEHELAKLCNKILSQNKHDYLPDIIKIKKLDIYSIANNLFKIYSDN